MDNAKSNSANKLSKSTVKSDVFKNSGEFNFSDDESLPTHEPLATILEKISESDRSHYISQCSDTSIGIMEVIQIKSILNYKDLRSVLQWCRKNNVFVFHQGNKQFVNRWEFTLSFYKPFIIHLKKKHNNWKDMFLHYISGNLGVLLGKDEKEKLHSSKSYKPKNAKESSFLNKMKKL